MEHSTDVPVQQKSSPFTLITSPSQYFGTRKDGVPWLWPVLIASIVTGVLKVLELPYYMKSPQVVKSLAAAQAKAAQSGANASQLTHVIETSAKVSVVVAGFLGPWIGVFVAGVILWLIIKLFGISMRYMNTVGVLANGYLINTIGAVLTAIVTFSTGTMAQGFLSLHEIIHVTGKSATLLSGISVFWLWWLYVVTVGISESGRSSRGRAFAAVFVVSALGVLVSFVL